MMGRNRLVPVGRMIFVSAAVMGGVSVALADGPVVQQVDGARYRVTFSYRAEPPPRTVHLAGSFNGWSMTDAPMDGPGDAGRFTMTLELEQGRYEYKFVVNGGEWVSDPENQVQVGPYGNSVVYVGVPADEGAVGIRRPAPEQYAAAIVENLPEIVALEEAVRGGAGPDRVKVVREWLSAHPMPLWAADRVGFVCYATDASRADLLLPQQGTTLACEMQPLDDGASLFAITLKRGALGEAATYGFRTEVDGQWRALADPNARSVTSRSGQPVGALTEPSADRGHIELIQSVNDSAGKLRTRDVYVYCPPGYDAKRKEGYPVLYLHDGQNCWDDPTEPFGHGGWQVNVTADRLISSGQAEPFIVVGVPNTQDRRDEYGPRTDILNGEKHAYLRYLLRDIKPLIDKRYRSKSDAAHTFVMGSSMGGIISLQAALLYPDVFGGAGVLSPAFYFEDEAGRDYFDLVETVGRQPVRLYIDSGTAGRGEDGAPSTRRMVELLRKAGWSDGKDLMHFEDTGAEHNERAWRARVDRPLLFLFGKRE